MNRKDRDETIQMIADSLHEVMIPALEDVEKRLTDKINGRADKEDIGRIERKLDAMTDRLDRHGRDIEKLQAAVA